MSLFDRVVQEQEAPITAEERRVLFTVGKLTQAGAGLIKAKDLLGETTGDLAKVSEVAGGLVQKGAIGYNLATGYTITGRGRALLRTA